MKWGDHARLRRDLLRWLQGVRVRFEDCEEMSDGADAVDIGVRHTPPLEQIIKTATKVISLQLLVFYKQLANDGDRGGLAREDGCKVFLGHYSDHTTEYSK